jgi:hypothetical protein
MKYVELDASIRTLQDLIVRVIAFVSMPPQYVLLPTLTPQALFGDSLGDAESVYLVESIDSLGLEL